MAAGIPLLLAGLLAAAAPASSPARVGGDDLAREFRDPPAAARPWVYWFWIHGNITRAGITADLEAMARVGIGGVLIMEVRQDTPPGPVAFAGPEWRELFRHALREAARLGLEVNMNNDAGWCGSGGPWITPELSMQKVVWSETAVAGPGRCAGPLPAPPAVQGFYRDIAVLAFPTPGAVVPLDRILDLTDRMAADGRLDWEAPAGGWTVLRLGHTSTGRTNHPSPPAGQGLECDKLSRRAVAAHYAGLMAKLVADAGPLAGKTLVSTHIDSWEVGSQDWTPGFREEFRRRRGYDLLPYLTVLAGRTVGGRETTERFLWDLRQTVSELLLDNYAGGLRELARADGLRLSIEAYHSCPTDELAYAGRADEPMGEFWSWWWPESGYDMAFSCTEAASAAHVYGLPVVGAEAFTATDAERWLGHPRAVKAQGDWAFCEGINRFVFHRYALQPWLDRRPGMGMGPWGLHYERTQTWWEASGAWHAYLARCQHLLRQGLFVADVCYLGPEQAPFSLAFQDRFLATPGDVYVPRERGGHNFDVCPPEALLARVAVRGGRLVLPDGMSYALLVLPAVEAMTPELLEKVKELVEAGAAVAGGKPRRSPSLNGWPECDAVVARLAAELFGEGEAPEEITERRIGRGRVFRGKGFEKNRLDDPTFRLILRKARWIWRDEGDPRRAVPPETRYFRRLVQVHPGWQAATLVMTADNRFTCWINGEKAGSGRDHRRLYEMDVTSLLRPGANLLAVLAENTTDRPNPAGVLGMLRVRYPDGLTATFSTGDSWEAAAAAPEDWRTDPAAGEGWTAARDLGPFGIGPWEGTGQDRLDPRVFPEEEPVARVLARMGISPDFSFRTRSGERSLRCIHRRLPEAELYFVANKEDHPVEALCSFRVQGRRPELWWPATGLQERPAVYEAAGDEVRLPLRLGPSGSVFVVFREAAAGLRVAGVRRDGKSLPGTAWEEWARPLPDEETGLALSLGEDGEILADADREGDFTLRLAGGADHRLEIPPVPPPLAIGGPWELRFEPGGGAPPLVRMPELIPWNEHPDPGVRHYSGAGTCTAAFAVAPETLAPDRRLWLDLGRVEVIAQVRLNGRELGTLWHEPYRVEATGLLRQGENTLEVRVANLWVNRLIGDEQLPEDSDREPRGTLRAWPEWLAAGKPSPAGRVAFATWRRWKKDDPLVPSGLIGPVRIVTTLRRVVRAGPG